MIRVTIWNEFINEKTKEKSKKLYPDGIHTALAEALGKYNEYEIKTATFDMPEHGLTEEVLNNTDVLIWWAHTVHAEVSDEVVERVLQRVLSDGMGIIFLHSAHFSKPFKRLMGTRCHLRWHMGNFKERIWVIEPSHPIARDLPEYFDIPIEETYGEHFDIPAPDELVFISWFSGGEVCRSGCCYKRGRGKVFYFRPGHETYPTFYQKEIIQVIKNSVDWAAPTGGPNPAFGKTVGLEPEFSNNN